MYNVTIIKNSESTIIRFMPKDELVHLLNSLSFIANRVINKVDKNKCYKYQSIDGTKVHIKPCKPLYNITVIPGLPIKSKVSIDYLRGVLDALEFGDADILRIIKNTGNIKVSNNKTTIVVSLYKG